MHIEELDSINDKINTENTYIDYNIMLNDYVTEQEQLILMNDENVHQV